jgi:hypothetical protein
MEVGEVCLGVSRTFTLLRGLEDLEEGVTQCPQDHCQAHSEGVCFMTFVRDSVEPDEVVCLGTVC